MAGSNPFPDPTGTPNSHFPYMPSQPWNPPDVGGAAQPTRYRDLLAAESGYTDIHYGGPKVAASDVVLRRHEDKNFNLSLAMAEKTPLWLWQPEKDNEEIGYAGFTLDQLNRTLAMASYVKWKASRGATGPGGRPQRLTMLQDEYWGHFPTTIEDIVRDFQYVGYAGNGVNETRQNASEFTQPFHRKRIVAYGEMNNVVNYWATDNMRPGNKVGFMLVARPIVKLQLPEFSRDTMSRISGIGTLHVPQYVPWCSGDFGCEYPPNATEGHGYQSMATDSTRLTEIIFESDDINDPRYGMVKVASQSFQMGHVIVVGIVKNILGKPSVENAQKALVSFDGVLDLERTGKKIDLIHLENNMVH